MVIFMASTIIHICVAKEVNKKIKYNEKNLYLGTIAPDISKLIGKNKQESHFLNTKNIPNIEKFLKKYKGFLTDSFLMGYLIHLYTDKIWFKDFINSFIKNNNVKLINGDTVKLDSKFINNLIYNDYTNLNIDLIDHYNLDLSLFYEEIIYPTIKFDEIPINKLDILVDQMGIIIKNSTHQQLYLLNMEEIKKFIQETSEYIYNELINNNLISTN